MNEFKEALDGTSSLFLLFFFLLFFFLAPVLVGASFGTGRAMIVISVADSPTRGRRPAGPIFQQTFYRLSRGFRMVKINSNVPLSWLPLIICISMLLVTKVILTSYPWQLMRFPSNSFKFLSSGRRNLQRTLWSGFRGVTPLE